MPAQGHGKSGQGAKERRIEVLVHYDILSGNMGDGWQDANAAAEAYGNFVEPRLYDAIAAFAPDAAIRVDIVVARNTGGASRGLRVIADPNEVPFSAQHRLWDLLDLRLRQCWDAFCASDLAADL